MGKLLRRILIRPVDKRDRERASRRYSPLISLRHAEERDVLDPWIEARDALDRGDFARAAELVEVSAAALAKAHRIDPEMREIYAIWIGNIRSQIAAEHAPPDAPTRPAPPAPLPKDPT